MKKELLKAQEDLIKTVEEEKGYTVNGIAVEEWSKEAGPEGEIKLSIYVESNRSNGGDENPFRVK